MDSTKIVPASDDILIQAVNDAYSATARTGADPSCMFPAALV
jgi:hypothetical protein